MPRKIIPLVALCLVILSSFSKGTTLQVSEDSYAVDSAKMDKNSGKSHALEVSPGCPAYMRFDAGDFTGQIPAADVTGARLTFYIAKRQIAGELNIHRVMSEWTESPSGNRNLPSYPELPLATLHASSLREGQFVVVDVTDVVKQWLSSPERDFGLAIVGNGKAVYLIPSKEGPEKGLSATLEIDHHPLVDNSRVSAGLNAAKLGNGSVSNQEFSFMNGVKSSVQGQLDSLGVDLAKAKQAINALGTDLDGSSADIAKLGADLSDLDSKMTGLDGDLSDLNSTVTGLGTDLTNLTSSSAGKVSKAGDTMSGTLLLPTDGLKVGINQLAIAAGKVGIGTDTPSAALEVRGDVKLGAAGDLQAAAGEEPLRVVRGVLENQNGNLILISGSGFSFAPLPLVPGSFEVIFSRAFSSPPSVTVEEEVRNASSTALGEYLKTAEPSRIEIRHLANPQFSGIRIHFVAIGPR